jgi:flagellar hook protein FlgE
MGDSAMNTAVSALSAQSAALSTISQNLANSSTTGYKALDSSFYDQVVQQTYNTTLLSGGVKGVTSQNVDVQGTIASATSTTDLAIDGNGMLAVSDGLSGNQTYYTRDGNFTTDSSGYLVLSGTDYYLKGWQVDSTGAITSTNSSSVGSLVPVNVEKYNTTATPTTYEALKANLPAEAQGTTTGFNTTLTVYDSLGAAQYVNVSFAPSTTTTGSWTMTVGPDATNAAGSTTGVVSSANTYTVTFGTDGGLDTISGSSMDSTGNNPLITIGSYTDGAATSSVTLSLGTANSTADSFDGLTQYDSGESSPTINVKSISNNGVAYGQLQSVSVSSDGTVEAKYSNGSSVPIFKIPVVSFGSYDGLQAMSSNVYEATTDSGNPVLNQAGYNGTGTVDGGSLEGSTVNTSTEFSNMIVCQQAYSAAAQVITTDKSMYTSLLNTMQ